MKDQVKHAQRLELFKQGRTYAEIAASEGVTPSVIRQWRRENGLPGRRCKKQSFDERHRLYCEGLNDSRIGTALGFDRSTIRLWRKSRGLPPVATCLTDPEAMLERRRAYDDGLDDRSIAEMEGCSTSRIQKWRWRSRLPKNSKDRAERRGLTSDREAARRFMYEAGYSDGRIARAEHINSTSIAKWRYARGLPAHRRPRSARDVSRENHGHDPLRRRIEKAIGKGLASDVAGDAISSLYLDIVERRVALKDVERVARRYRNSAIAQWANKYGDRSLDENIGEEGDFRLIDAIADEEPSSWLEEMGATVW